MTRRRHAREKRPVAVVTGGSAGVGRATALALAKAGHDVAILARDEEGLASAAAQIETVGARCLTLACDIADAAAVVAFSDRVAEAWGGIDVWVNNAMATIFAPVHRIAPEEFKRVTEVTYLGQVYGTLSALKHMRPRGHGTIVQVGSALSYRAIPLQSAYCAAKFAVRGFTDSLRSELIYERSRIRLVMVQLPAVNTPQFDWARSRLPREPEPVPPIYQPEAVAAEILKAVRDPPRELWIGWPSIRAIVANMIAPSLLDRLAAADAWDSQMAHQPSPERAGNLFEPVAGDPGAHGRFDDTSRPRVASASSAAVRAAIAAAALAATSIAAAALSYSSRLISRR